MTETKNIYAIYLRKSRADLEKEQYGDFETLAKHEKELIELAKRKKLIVEETYKELVSGEHISERHEFQKMMKEVSSGKYAGIIVHSISRLGRGNPMEYGWTLMTFQMSKTLIITPTKIYDPNNEEDSRYLQMEMFINNMELGNIKSRMISGERAAAKAGCFIKSMAAYGYDRIKKEGKWTLEPNDDAKIVQLIFEQAAKGISHGQIARELNKAKIPTAKGKQWSAARILTILKNPHYKGKIRYGYYKNEQIMGDGFQLKRHQTINEDYILVDGLHKPIVTPEMWDAANKKIKNAPCLPNGHELKNPLAGLLVCAKCGRSMVRFINHCPSNGNKIEHYRHAAFSDCHMRGANLNTVVNLVIEALEEYINEFKLTGTCEDNITKINIEACQTALDKENAHIDKLMELFFAEAITIEEFKEHREKSEKNKEALTEQLNELKREKKTPSEITYYLKIAISMLKDKDISAQEKNQALKTIIERIEFDNHTKSRKQADIRLNIVLRD